MKAGTKAGGFRKAAKARERTHVLEAQGLVKNTGKVRLDGRLHDFWATRDIANLQHEAEVTEVIVHLLPLGVEKIVRAPDVEPQYNADAELTLTDGATMFYLEHDRDSMGTRPLLDRMLAYTGCPHHILWICPHRTRLEAMKKLAAGIDALFWFTTYAEILANARGHILENVLGEKGPFIPPREEGQS